MANNDLITIEVAYAKPDDQRIIKLAVSVDCTIQTAIDRSGMIEIFPEIDLSEQKVGIFGKIKKLSDTVKQGDRIEIYRALTIDPKDLRRKKVEMLRKKRINQARNQQK